MEEQKVTGRRMKIEEVEDNCAEKGPSSEQEDVHNNVESVEHSAADATRGTRGTAAEKTVAEMDSQNQKEKSRKQSKKGKKSPKKDKASAEEGVTSRGAGEPDPMRVDEEKDAGSKMAAFAENSTPVNVETPSQPNSDTVAGDSDVSSAPPPPLEKNVLALKDAGNELFRTGQYADALHKYDMAIKKIPGTN